MTLLFVMICKKANDDRDFEFDHLDDGKPINKKYKFRKEVKKLTIFKSILFYFYIINFLSL